MVRLRYASVYVKAAENWGSARSATLRVMDCDRAGDGGRRGGGGATAEDCYGASFGRSVRSAEWALALRAGTSSRPSAGGRLAIRAGP